MTSKAGSNIHERLVAAPLDLIVTLASDMLGHPVDPFEHTNARDLHVDRLAKVTNGVRLECDRKDDRLRLVLDERPARLIWHRSIDGQPGWTTTETYNPQGESTFVRIATELHEPGSQLWLESKWPWNMLECIPQMRLAHLIRRAEGLGTGLAPTDFNPGAFVGGLITRCKPQALRLITEADYGEGSAETAKLLRHWASGKAVPQQLSWQQSENLHLAALDKTKHGWAAPARIVAASLCLLHATAPNLGITDYSLEGLPRTLHKTVLAIGAPQGSRELTRGTANLLLWLSSRELVMDELLRIDQLAVASWLLARDENFPDADIAALVNRGHQLALLEDATWPTCPDPIAAGRLQRIADSD